MTDQRPERTPFNSFSLLIQELIAGTVKRHVFTPLEMELMLDLELAHLNKSSRPDTLRRYQRAVNQSLADGSAVPVRLCAFLEREREKRHPQRRAAASAGLSSK